MCGEQKRLHRHSARRCELSGRILQPLGNAESSRPHPCVAGGSWATQDSSDVAWDPANAVTPEILRHSTFERFPLETRMLGKHGRRMDLGVDRRHVDAQPEQVVLHQFTYQIRDAPAVQNRVMKREDQIHSVVADKRT